MDFAWLLSIQITKIRQGVAKSHGRLENEACLIGHSLLFSWVKLEVLSHRTCEKPGGDPRTARDRFLPEKRHLLDLLSPKPLVYFCFLLSSTSAHTVDDRSKHPLTEEVPRTCSRTYCPICNVSKMQPIIQRR